MIEPICCAIAQKTAIEAITFADRPEFGHGETADRPMAAPNVSRTNESAAASTAPANTAPHSTKLRPAVSTLDATGTPTCVMAVASYDLMQPEEAQDEHHDHDQTDRVNDAVHGSSPCQTIRLW